MCYFYDIMTGNISKKTCNITGRHILNVNRYEFILGFFLQGSCLWEKRFTKDS